MTLDALTRRGFLQVAGVFLFQPNIPLFSSEQEESFIAVADDAKLLASLRNHITAAQAAEITKYGKLTLTGDSIGTFADLVERVLHTPGIHYGGNVTDVVVHAAVDPVLRARIALVSDATLLLDGYHTAVERATASNTKKLSLNELERAALETQLDSFHRLLSPVDQGLATISTADLPVEEKDKEEYQGILTKRLTGKAYEDAVAVINRRLKDRINKTLATNNNEYALTDNTPVVENVAKARQAHPTLSHKDLAKHHRERGLHAYEAKDFATALREHEVAVALDPLNARYHNGLGAAYSGLGRIQEAIKEYRIAITFDPVYDEPYLNLSMGLSNLNRHKEAVIFARRALKIGCTSHPEQISQIKAYISAVENLR